MGEEIRETAAAKLADAAAELRKAADHLDIAADHFRSGEVPRGCAHGFATEGHAAVGRGLIEANAITHSKRACTV
jgi:hypothetical protein